MNKEIEVKEDSPKKERNKKSAPKVEVIKYKDIHQKLLHVKVGNSAFPATEEQIKDIQDKIVDLLERNNVDCLAFVTHHAVEIDIIEKVT